MRKSKLVKATVCFMAATVAVSSGPFSNVTNGVVKTVKAAEKTAVKSTAVAEFSFDGTVDGENYQEDGISFRLKNGAGIVENPDKSGEKVLYTNGGYVETDAGVLSDVDFSEGFTISMDVRPDVQAIDWNYLFCFGCNGVEDGKWNYVDGTVGFIQRFGDPYCAFFPADGWVEGNMLGGSGEVNPYDYFLKEENCNKWYNMRYVYAKDAVEIYIDNVLTQRHILDDQKKNDIAAVLSGLSEGKLRIGCGIDPNLEHMPAYFDNVKIFNSAVQEESAPEEPTPEEPTPEEPAPEEPTPEEPTPEEPAPEDPTPGVTTPGGITVPGEVVTAPGITVKKAKEVAKNMTPSVKFTFDGETEGRQYRENGIAFSMRGSTTRAAIVENPDVPGEKVLYTGDGYITTDARALSTIDFSNGFTISMDVRPDVQMSDWNYLFSFGMNGIEDGKWNYLDGTMGFIQRWGDPYNACFPYDGWVNGNPLGGSSENNLYDYFMREENCNQWYNLTYVYGLNTVEIYIDGVLTQRHKLSQEQKTGMAGVLAGLSEGRLNIGCGIDSNLEHTAAYYDNVKIFNKALTQAQMDGESDAVNDSKTVDCSNGFALSFSDAYTIVGDCDVSFDIQMSDAEPAENWYTPSLFISNAKERGSEGYIEYAVVRSDAFGWGSAWDENTVDYECSWLSGSKDADVAAQEWANFRKFMRNAKITWNLIRMGDDFTVTALIQGSDGKEYTYKATFSLNVEEKLQLAFTGDAVSFTVNSYSGNVFQGVNGLQSFEYDAYQIKEGVHSCVVRKEDNTYDIDLTKLFRPDTVRANPVLNINPGETKAVTLDYGNGKTRDVKIEMISYNACTGIEVADEDQAEKKVALNREFVFKTYLTGEHQGRVMDAVYLTGDAAEEATLPEELRYYFMAEDSYLELKSMKDNKTGEEKKLDYIVGNEDRKTDIWSTHSDYYTLGKDADVTFEFINHGGTLNWDNYLVAFSNNLERGQEGYKEYAVVRSDGYIWDDGIEGLKRDSKVNYDWNWNDFTTIMRDAAVSMNIKRDGDNITVRAEITPLIAAGQKETYIYEVVNSFQTYSFDSSLSRDKKDYNCFIGTVKPIKTGKGTVVINCGSATPQAIRYECVDNYCEKIEIVDNSEQFFEPWVGTEQTIKLKATGVDKDILLTDSFEVSADSSVIDVLPVSLKELNGETIAEYKVISKTVTESAITIKCGDVTMPLKINAVPKRIAPITPSAIVTNGAISTAIPQEVNGSGGFWTDFSDTYLLTGDFEVDFELETSDTEILNTWETPCYVFSNAAAVRNSEEYQDLVIRSDAWGWSENADNKTLEGNDITYEASWLSDTEDEEVQKKEWEQFRQFMRNAKISSHISRRGDDFEVYSIIHGSDGKDYTYNAKFTTKVSKTIGLFFTIEKNSMTIKSYTNMADYVDNASLPAGVTLNADGVYEISEEASCVKKKDGKYEVDLAQIFKPASAGKEVVEGNKETTVNITLNENTQSFQIKVKAKEDTTGGNTGGSNSGTTGGNTGGSNSGATGGNTGGSNSGTTGGNTGNGNSGTTGSNTGNGNSGTTGGNTGNTTTDKENEGASQNKPVTETKPDGTKVETSTETKADGTKTEAVTETKTDGSKTETVTETKTDGSKTETVKETKADGSTAETVKETKADGSTAETVKETKADGSSKETKEITTADNTASLKTTAETDKNGKTTADAVISTGASKKAGVIEIAKELLESAAEVVNSFVVEISKDTIQSTDAKKVNTVVNISIPSVEGIDVDKVVLNKESIQAAKETGKGLKVNVANGDDASADSYTVTIPVKQLAKIKNSVENLNITINTNNAKDAAAENKALTKAVTASKANQKKTCVVSVAENNQTKNVGMKVTIPVTGKSDIKEGNKVYVYKFNKETGKLEEAANSKQTVSADGTIAIAAAGGSDYIVSAKKLAGKNVETIKDKIDVSLPKNEVKAGKEMKVKVSLPDTVSTKAKFGTEKAEITYKSGNNGVASVSANGTITTKKKGTVTITIVIKLESGQKITQKQKITIK